MTAVSQPMVGFHQDEHGDWVARLACGGKDSHKFHYNNLHPLILMA